MDHIPDDPDQGTRVPALEVSDDEIPEQISI
jgi:hypothetical protein